MRCATLGGLFLIRWISIFPAKRELSNFCRKLLLCLGGVSGKIYEINKLPETS
jgi:hypothetical protein